MHPGAVVMLVAALATAGCASGDPGYSVAIRNDSDASLVVRISGSGHVGGPRAWDLPAHGSGWVLTALGPPREAAPIAYEIVEATSCEAIGLQRVDFSLAPNPGYSQFTVVIGADRSLRVEARTSADPAISASLEATESCPNP